MIESNGSDEFVDQEAGGFDEGEGSKNVSDNIDKDNLVISCNCTHLVMAGTKIFLVYKSTVILVKTQT